MKIIGEILMYVVTPLVSGIVISLVILWKTKEIIRDNDLVLFGIRLCFPLQNGIIIKEEP